MITVPEVRMAPETARRLRDLPKGDALTTAQLAGIMAAKRTSELIPLCHPLPLTHISVELMVAEGEMVPVGTPIISIGDPSEKPAAAPPPSAGPDEETVARAIREGDRNLVGATAPACGLTLKSVHYD